MGFNKVIPSIASVVASLNRHATHYCERSRLQEHRTEIIQVGGRCILWLEQLPRPCLSMPLKAAGTQRFFVWPSSRLVFVSR